MSRGSPVNALLQPALRQLDLGYYARALSLLNELCIAHETDFVACHLITIELVRVHLLSGALASALDVATKSLARFPASHLESLEIRSQQPGAQLSDESCAYLVLLVQKALATIPIEGLVNHALQTATRVATLLPADVPRDASDCTRQLLLLEYYCHKIFWYACDLHLTPWDHIRAGACQRLEPLVTQLCRVARYTEAFMLVMEQCRSLGVKAKIAKLTSFQIVLHADAQRASNALMAMVNLELADAFFSQMRIANTKYHLVQALTFYSEAGHALGHLYCRQLQARLVDKLFVPPWSPFRTTNAKVQIVLVHDLERGSDTTSELQVLRNLQAFAFETYNRQLDSATAQRVQEILSVSGSWFLDTMYQIAHAATMLAKTGHSGKILESLHAILPRIEALQIPYYVGVVASIIGQVYEHMMDGVRALEFAEKAHCEWAKCGARQASAAVTQMLRSRMLLLSSSSLHGREQRRADLIQSVQEWVDRDIAAGSWMDATDKSSILVSLQTDQAPVGSPYGDTSQSILCLDRLMKLAEVLPEEERNRVLAFAQQQRVPLFMKAGDIDNAVSGLKDALKIYVEQNMLFQGAIIRQQLGLCYLDKYQRRSEVQDLIDATNEFEIAYDACEKMGLTSQCISAAYFLVRCLFAWCLLLRGNAEVIHSTLNAMHGMEKWTDYMRQELSSMRPSEAILQKQALARDKHCRELYSMAQQLCLAEDMLADFWTWVQKGKARSLADLLALGVILPDSLRQAARKNPDAWALLQKRDAVLYQIQHAPPERRMLLRNQCDDLHDQMMGVPELSSVLALQLGWSLNLERLRALFNAQEALTNVNIVVVDWVSPNGKQLKMMVVDRRLQPQVYDLAIGVGQVESWISENFTDLERQTQCLMEDVDDPDAMFRQLDPLIAPLRICTAPDDLLVFCATAPLHSLPLHALKLHERGGPITLIQRNPVHYCPALTIYEQCVTKALHTAPVCDNRDAGVRLAAVYDISSKNAGLIVEQEAIHEHMENLRAQLGAQAADLLWGPEVTKHRLREFVKDGSLIHFHGHCDFDKTNALRQRLILARTSCEKAVNVASAPSVIPVQESAKSREQLLFLSTDRGDEDLLEVEADTLSVGEILSLSLTSSPHVTVIACDSASQEINPGDEPLGIATAFLCAGATSFVGTLWRIPTREGRAFSDMFYHSFHAQNEGDFVDLARALQRAVLGVMENIESRGFLYWAPLVLHGAWFCRRPKSSLAIPPNPVTSK